jgi:hypothetical protein
MSIGLGLYLSPDLSSKVEVFSGLSQHLDKIFKGYRFSDDIDSIGIGIICVAPKFDAFFSPKKPKLTKSRKNRLLDDLVIKNAFQYEIKLDYAKVKSLDNSGLVHYLKEMLTQSLEIIKDNVSIKKMVDYERV